MKRIFERLRPTISRFLATDENTPRELRVLEICLLAGAAILPFSPGAAMVLICVCGVPAWISCLVRHREFAFLRSPYFWPVVTFIGLAIVVSIFGVRPLFSLRKSYRLLPAAIIFMMGTMVFAARGHRWRIVTGVVTLFVAACSIKAIADGLLALDALRQGFVVQWSGKLSRAAFYMVALSFLLALTVHQPIHRHWKLISAGIVLNGIGLFVNFKRGTWVAFALLVLMMGLVTRRYKLPLLLGLIAAASLLIPTVRTRLLESEQELGVAKGGRYAAWTQVAPRLIRDHPFGVGYHATRAEDFAEYWSQIEPIHHLHNNILQVTAEMGWLGLGVWLIWMIVTWRVMRAAYQRVLAIAPEYGWVALGSWCAFAGLFANGMVDNNFITTSLMMVYFYLMGLSDVLARTAPVASVASSESLCRENHHAGLTPKVA